MIREIPNDFQLINRRNLKYSSDTKLARLFNRFINEGLEWPSSRFIQSNKVDINRFKDLSKDSLSYLAHVLKDKWIAEDIGNRLIAIKNGMDGYDCFLARYEKAGYYIQIAIKKSKVELVFLSSASPKAFSSKCLKDNALNCMNRFLKDFDKIKNIKWNIINFDNFAIGYQFGEKYNLDAWYKTLSWLTDGLGVLLRIKRIEILLKEETKVKEAENLDKKKKWFEEGVK